MNIGVEISNSLILHHSGLARYASSLVEMLLARQYQIQGWAHWRRLPGWVLKPKNLPIRFFGDSPSRNRPRLFHATAGIFPEWKSPIEIATVHDLYAMQPCFNSSESKYRQRIRYIERADRIICVSDFTRTQLHTLLEIPADRSVTIPLAVAPSFAPAEDKCKERLRRRLRLPEEFLLFVGSDRVNKNLDRLTQAYAISKLEMPLCFAGSYSRRTRHRLLRIMQEHRGAGSLRWLGTIFDPDLPALLSSTSALCMPSLLEGFGLPIIEAMACGAPVLTSAGRATEETAGGKGILVDPESVESITEGLHQVLAMTDAQLADARAHATRRTWGDVARETWKVYES